MIRENIYKGSSIKKSLSRLLTAYCLLLTAFFLTACYSGKKKQEEKSGVDLPQIMEQGEITAVTMYSSTSYFLYRMEPMGYEYDLIKNFADSKGLKLKIKVAENATRLTEMLFSGEADIVAHPVLFDNELKKDVVYCGREELSYQVLVQRMDTNSRLVRDVTELIGKDIYVKHNTKYHERLKNLNAELGGGIHIHDIQKDTITAEELIEMVSTGSIPYTVSDDRTARLNKTYYWNIDVSLDISFMQRSSWVVRKSSPKLAEAINAWATDNISEPVFRAADKRYFELNKKILKLSMPEIHSGNISPYDELFKKHAPGIGWDWKLLAALSYQESHFKNNLESWAGAQGLMGIMPGTAIHQKVAVEDLSDPEINIRTGIKVLREFQKGFEAIPDSMERIKFTLASYNAGIGHLYDARRLAEKHGKDPNRWDDNVAEYIRLKSDPEYYNDPVVRHGYLRGAETFNYVREILGRYDYYLKQLKIEN